MRDANRGRELERVLRDHGPALGRLAASHESRPALREERLQTAGRLQAAVRGLHRGKALLKAALGESS